MLELPQTPAGWAAVVMALVLALIVVSQRAALMRIRRADVNTDKSAVENERDRAAIAQSTLLNEIAATALKTQEREGNHRVALAELKGRFDVQAVRLDFLDKSNTRLEAANLALTEANARLEKRIDDRDETYRLETVGTNAQIDSLKAKVAQQNSQIDGFPALIAALRAELVVKANPDASAAQVSAAEKASADATAATLTPGTVGTTVAGETHIEGVVKLTTTAPPAETKDEPK